MRELLHKLIFVKFLCAQLYKQAVPDCTTKQYQVKINSTRFNGKRLLTQTPIHRNQLCACFHLSIGRCQTGIRNTSLKI